MVIRPHPFNGRRGGTLRGRSGRPPVGPILAGRYGKFAGNSRVERPSFHAPLRTSIAQILGSGAPTFTRATTATVKDHDGIIRTVLSGEARFQGARRVRNYITAPETQGDWTIFESGSSTSDFTALNAEAPDGSETAGTLTMVRVGANLPGISFPNGQPAGTSVFSIWIRAADGGTHSVNMRPDSSGSVTVITVDGEWRRYATTPTTATAAGNAQLWMNTANSSATLQLWRPQLENVNGQSVQTPGEYVSVGVKSAPYHGANVDGVRYFDRHNGNVVRQNLHPRSEDLANWTLSQGTVESNATLAPDGTYTADKWVENTTAGVNHIIRSAVTFAGNQYHTHSVYVKAGGRNEVQLGISTTVESTGLGATAIFHLVNGTIRSIFACTARMEDAGGGWWRCSITFLTQASPSTIGPFHSPINDLGSATYQGDGVSGIYIWGAQTQPGHHASTYVSTTSAAVNTGIVESYQGPAITESSLLGYLAEGARTNLCLQSEDFGTTWTLGSDTTRSLNSTVAPDGATTADTIQAGAGNTSSNIRQDITLTANTAYTVSVFMKAGTSARSGISLFDATGTDHQGFLNINWTDGVPSTQATSGTVNNVNYEAFPNGWYRISFQTTSDAANTAYNLFIYPDRVAGTGNVIVWGAQLEATSFASSYIPTTSASVTRNSDVLSYNATPPQEAGTLFVQITPTSLDTNGHVGVSLNEASGGEEMIYLGHVSTSRLFVNDGNVAQANLTGGAMTAGVPSKLAASFAVDDFAISLDGGAVGSDTSGTLPTTTQINIGSQSAGGNSLFGSVKNVRIWKRQLSDAQLQAMTA